MSTTTTAPATSSLHPELNGMCMKLPEPEKMDVFLIIDGARSFIPPDVYGAIFPTGMKPDTYAGLFDICRGEDLDSKTVLIKPNNSNSVYLLTKCATNWVKRGVSAEAATRYHFDMQKVQAVPPAVDEIIAKGHDVP